MGGHGQEERDGMTRVVSAVRDTNGRSRSEDELPLRLFRHPATDRAGESVYWQGFYGWVVKCIFVLR